MITPCPDRFLEGSTRALASQVATLAAEARRLMMAAESLGDGPGALALGDIARLADRIAGRRP